MIKEKNIKLAVKRRGVIQLTNKVDDKTINVLLNYFYGTYNEFLQLDYFNTLTTPNNKKTTYETNRIISSMLKDFLDEIFVDYQVVIGLFYFSKAKGTEVGGIHQDPSFSKPSVPYLTLWIPLTDCKDGQGLSFVEYSHLLFCKFHDKTSSLNKKEKEILMRNLKKFDMYKGEALLFDNSVFHKANINAKNTPRISIGIKLLPKGAPYISYQSLNSYKGILYEHRENIYLTKDWSNYQIRDTNDRKFDYFSMKNFFVKKIIPTQIHLNLIRLLNNLYLR